LASDIDPRVLAEATEGLSGAEIEVICREAAMLAIRESILAENKKSRLQISKEHFNLAINWLKAQKGEE
jgi:transitional endoplasmic reticulum ATPase